MKITKHGLSKIKRNNMKNIHILPTDKPSKLHEFGDIWFSYKEPTECFRNYNIYITYDEEIKTLEYEIYYDKVLKKVGNSIHYGKKIILTTDPDLIKDGVQSIDDTFLEWFVKNPSCERVEIETKDNWYVHTGSGKYWEDEPVRMKRLLNLGDYEYKIIIPQEEPKQEVTGVDDNRPKPNYCYAKEQGHGEIGCVFPACHCGLPIKQEEPLQETLEEAALKYAESNQYDLEYYDEGGYQGIEVESFAKKLVDFTSKWQQQRMYSEEDMINFAHFYFKEEYNLAMMEINKTTKELLSEWFEQYKKK
jgi:hypothetical protein